MLKYKFKLLSIFLQVITDLSYILFFHFVLLPSSSLKITTENYKNQGSLLNPAISISKDIDKMT